jgi:hypothetical protein
VGRAAGRREVERRHAVAPRCGRHERERASSSSRSWPLSSSLSRPGAGRSTSAAARGRTACPSSPDKISALFPILWRPGGRVVALLFRDREEGAAVHVHRLPPPLLLRQVLRCPGGDGLRCVVGRALLPPRRHRIGNSTMQFIVRDRHCRWVASLLCTVAFTSPNCWSQPNT